MLKTFLLSMALLGLTIPNAITADIPRPAPEVALELVDGKQILLSSYRGKVVNLVYILTT